MNVLITGVSQGIGEALALHYLKKGQPVIGLSRRPPTWTQDEPLFKHFPGNLEDEEFLKGLKQEISKLPIRAFVHGAMVSPPHRPFLRNKRSEYLQSYTVGVVSALEILQIISSSLKEHQGRVVFLGSQTLLTGTRGQMPYLAAKGALSGIVKGLALELMSWNITVNQILLGPVFTPTFEKNVSLEAQERIKEEVPQRRFLDIQEVAALVDFLLTPESRGITGSDLSLGAGLPLRNQKS